MKDKFYDLFSGQKPLIGMVHLAGSTTKEKMGRMLEEVSIYSEEGFGGVVVEDYHGDVDDVRQALYILSRTEIPLPIGVNVLSNPYSSFELADRNGASFVQFDTIQTSKTDTLNPRRFNETEFMYLRNRFPGIVVLGGVRFKYIPPTGRTLEEDVLDGMGKCDAIVTTGEGTGIATPTQKLRDFRELTGDFPLIVGAGVNNRNIQEQISIVDGAIIGSYVKGGYTENIVQRSLVRELVDISGIKKS